MTSERGVQCTAFCPTKCHEDQTYCEVDFDTNGCQMLEVCSTNCQDCPPKTNLPNGCPAQLG
jgi:hypothetical protein